MNKINVGRVLLGGLVAGIVISAGNFIVNRVWLRDAMSVEFARLRVPEPGTNFIAAAVVLTLIVGIAIVYLYASIRPRFGAGPKTAICAGLMAWVLAVLYPGVIIGLAFEMPVSLVVKRIVAGLVAYAIGAVLGAWLYKEEATPAV
jgi:hypothetical protein